MVTACRAGHSTGGRSFARFECSVDDALASVDRLAFSGYLERDRESPQVIVYKEESCDLPQPTRPPCTEVGATCVNTSACTALLHPILLYWKQQICDVHCCHLVCRPYPLQAAKWLKVV